MVNNCKYYRTRTEKNIKYGYCLKDKNKVPLFCKECEEYKKTIEEKLKVSINKPLKTKSKTLNKLERNRFSILVPSNKCCKCPATTDLTWHEVLRGRNRANSMKYGLCLRICSKCHEKYQEDKKFNDYWHKQAQLAFIKNYPDLDFLKIFKRNYL